MALSPKKQRFREVMAARGWTHIDAPQWQDLRAELPDVAEPTLRQWLRESGLSVAQPFAGVAVKTLDELEQSLASMSATYLSNLETRRACRAAVIQAKDRARFAAANQRAAPEKRALKQEMVQWMLVWLDDPAMFASWLALRKATRAHSSLT